jgi:dihydroxyacid dehydratase/phosphogluconate dehydratase
MDRHGDLAGGPAQTKDRHRQHFMSLSVCFAHLDDVANVVADAVRTAGGLPFEIRTTAPSDFVTSAGRKACYLMPTRDLVVNDVEAAVEGAVLDGMVLLSSCDKTTHLMAAARLDLPSVLVIGGYPTRRYPRRMLSQLERPAHSAARVGHPL